MNIGLAGNYTIYKRKAHQDQNENIKVAEFENLITNNGLDLIGQRASCNYLIASSSSSAPQTTDTSILVMGYTTFGAASHAEQKQTQPFWVSFTKIATFRAGVATGNIAKFAVSNNSTGDDLASIALVKDANGDPTVITKLADEILDVYYELRTYLDMSVHQGTIDISGTTHTTESRTVGLNDIKGFWFHNLYDSAYVHVNGSGRVQDVNNCNTTGTQLSRPFYEEYVNGSHQIKAQPRSLSINEANFNGGINCITFRASYYQEVFIDPPIMKDDTMTLQLPPLTISWGRYGGDP